VLQRAAKAAGLEGDWQDGDRRSPGDQEPFRPSNPWQPVSLARSGQTSTASASPHHGPPRWRTGEVSCGPFDGFLKPRCAGRRKNSSASFTACRSSATATPPPCANQGPGGWAPFVLRRLKPDKSIHLPTARELELSEGLGLSSEQSKLYRKTVDGRKTSDAIAGAPGRSMARCSACSPSSSRSDHHRPGPQGRGHRPKGSGAPLRQAAAAGRNRLMRCRGGRFGPCFHPSSPNGGTCQGPNSRSASARLVCPSSNAAPARWSASEWSMLPGRSRGPQLFLLVAEGPVGVGLNLDPRQPPSSTSIAGGNPACEKPGHGPGLRIGQTNRVAGTSFITSGSVERKDRPDDSREARLAEDIIGSGEGAGWFSIPGNRDLVALQKETDRRLIQAGEPEKVALALDCPRPQLTRRFLLDSRCSFLAGNWRLG